MNENKELKWILIFILAFTCGYCSAQDKGSHVDGSRTTYIKDVNGDTIEIQISQDKTVEIGKKYLYTWGKIDDKDPFERVRIDTVIVIDKKQGYVRWTLPEYEFVKSKYLSSKESDFKKSISEIRK